MKPMLQLKVCLVKSSQEELKRKYILLHSLRAKIARNVEIQLLSDILVKIFHFLGKVL